MERRGAFDYILLETTGLADPGNIAPLFWMDEGLGSSIYLDGVVTLVDARNILKTLDDGAPFSAVDTAEHEGHGDGDGDGGAHKGPQMTTAHLQISHADVVVVNKADLVDEEEMNRILQRVKSINALAKVHVTEHGRVPQLEGVVLDLHAYDGVGEIDFAEKGHSHLDPVSLTSSPPVVEEKPFAPHSPKSPKKKPSRTNDNPRQSPQSPSHSPPSHLPTASHA